MDYLFAKQTFSLILSIFIPKLLNSECFLHLKVFEFFSVVHGFFYSLIDSH